MKTILGFAAVVYISISVIMVNDFYLDAKIAINLADNGISTTATILEHRPSKGKTSAHSIILYDTNKGSIQLDNGNHPINSNIAVVYDKDNPKIVWMGNASDGAWELYKINKSVLGLFMMSFVFFISWGIVLLILREYFRQRRNNDKPSPNK